MPTDLLRLYPPSAEKFDLQGLYLAHRLHVSTKGGRAFVYANFLSSLDGRIALENAATGATYIPKHLKSASDFRLFKELGAQSDCLITHGGYLRALHAGELGNILQIRDDDLAEWRRINGLPPQPAIVIASASLDFPMHDSIREYGQTVFIATGKNARPERVRYWKDKGFAVLLCGSDQMVEGRPLIAELSQLGYKAIYLIAGPQMLDTMVREKQLSRLYLTITHQLLGGADFRSLMTGPPLRKGGSLMLEAMYYEPGSPPSSGQFFMQFGLDR
jgi:riboflavin biosynthesis pyrimidine reductase